MGDFTFLAEAAKDAAPMLKSGLGAVEHAAITPSEKAKPAVSGNLPIQATGEKPSFWKRTIDSIKNGFKAALEYIPRGIVLTGIVMGGSYLMGQAFDVPGKESWDIMGINGKDTMTLLSKGVKILSLGALTSFGFGTFQGAMNPGAPAAAPQAPTVGNTQSRGQGQERTLEREHGDYAQVIPAPDHGLHHVPQPSSARPFQQAPG